MGHFHNQICYDKDSNYKNVSDDLYKNGIFDDNDNEIANNIYRKVTIPNENKKDKSKKRNNDTRFKFMENEKVNYLIDMINDMDIKDKR